MNIFNKNILKTFVLLIFPFIMASQAPIESLSFYNGDKKEKLTANKEEILIKFSFEKIEEDLSNYAEKLINEFVQLQSLVEIISSENAIRFSINENFRTRLELEELIKVLLEKKEIISAYPVLRWRGEDVMITNTIIMAYNPNKVDLNKSKKFIKTHNLEITEEYVFPDNTVQLISLEKGKHTLEIANQLFELGESLYSQPNMISYAENHYTPNDDSLSTQWYLNNDGSNWNGTADADADILEAWDITTGSSQVKVAVLEGGGFDYNHVDANTTQPYDATNNDNDPAPQNANDNHGTAVMGCVSSKSNNTIGIAGTGYNTLVVPITIGTVFSNGREFNISDINMTRAANHIVNNVLGEGVFVVSNSWSGNNNTAVWDAAFDNMIDNARDGLGAVVMASSGNKNSNNRIRYPAIYPRVLAIGASSPCDTRKSPTSCDGENWGSNWGDSLNIMAPGVKIQTLDRSGAAGYNPTNYVPVFNGTSSACPIAAGITALVFSMDRCQTRQEVEAIICTTTDKIDTTIYNNVPNRPFGTWSRFTGYGRINAFKAVTAVNMPNANTSIVANRTDNSSVIYQNQSEINVGPNYFMTGNPYIQFRSGTSIIFQPKVQSTIGSTGLIIAKLTPSCINP
jgi:hypothetical protein